MRRLRARCGWLRDALAALLALTSVFGFVACATSPAPADQSAGHPPGHATPGEPARLPVVEWSSPSEGPSELPGNTPRRATGALPAQTASTAPPTSIALRARPEPPVDDSSTGDISEDPEDVASPPETAPMAAPGSVASGSSEQAQRPALKTTCDARVGENGLRRSALDETLDAGLGRWLRGIDVEPQMKGGHFQGWRVKGLFAGDPCWSGIDLRVGDVVRRINRRPIERPEQAQAVWSALRQAGEIVIDFKRAGRSRRIRFAVVEDL